MIRARGDKGQRNWLAGDWQGGVEWRGDQMFIPMEITAKARRPQSLSEPPVVAARAHIQRSGKGAFIEL